MEKDMELGAMNIIYETLKDLEPEAITRILVWTVDRLGVDITGAGKGGPSQNDLESDTKVTYSVEGLPSFETLSELFAKIRPETNADKALVSATFLQVTKGNEDLTAQQINNELKHLGHRTPNITDAISSLVDERPSLMIQIRKSGRTQQARKTHKVTDEGIKEVLRMLNEEDDQG